jgi:hypothetical protein
LSPYQRVGPRGLSCAEVRFELAAALARLHSKLEPSNGQCMQRDLVDAAKNCLKAAEHLAAEGRFEEAEIARTTAAECEQVWQEVQDWRAQVSLTAADSRGNEHR